MNIHEHQAKEILKEFGAPVSNGLALFSIDEIDAKLSKLRSGELVLKAQIDAGGRGKAGGVKLIKNKDNLLLEAKKMMGKTLVTHQTGPEGKEVNRLYIEEGCDIARELYMGMLMDRETSQLLIIASTEGGMDIEDVAEKTPEKILKISIDPVTGIRPYHARQLAFGLGLEGGQIKSSIKLVMSLYKAFNELDCSMVEINPLVVTGAGASFCRESVKS